MSQPKTLRQVFLGVVCLLFGILFLVAMVASGGSQPALAVAGGMGVALGAMSLFMDDFPLW